MRSSVFSRLAATNLKNNRKTYVPYILTSILTVMMYYIMDGLSKNPYVTEGNESLQICLQYANGIIIVFAVIFLFYTNSFLIKRRKKEIGIYNILGMGKQHIAKMLAVETTIMGLISIGAGLLFGVVFSKLMFLLLLKILHYDIRMGFSVSAQSIVTTIVLFAGIFLLTLVYNLLQIKLANPVELLRGGSQGEKEPKTKLLLAIFGAAALGTGYYIAITTESPVSALGMFFIAVLCVILGTYALFIAGSIVLLKLLRRNKRYYYQTKHFTAVSGMIYRMKQNAVGLANICILSTMVLVMVSTTVSLYVGVDDVLKTRFPNEFQINLKRPDVASEQRIADIVSGVTEKNGVKPVSETGYHYGSLTAFLEKNEFQLYGAGDYSAEDACGVTLIPLEDYNKMEETTVNLAGDEVLLFYDGTDTFNQDTISLDGRNYRVAKELDGMKIKKKSASETIATYYIIMKDTNQIQACLDDAYQNSDLDEEWKALYQSMDYQYAFDMQGDEEHKTQAMTEIRNRITQEVPEAFCAGRELNRESFYSLYGGLLFIGIYLGAIFLMATVLIIYYKQISEGYDDRERYQIMQKVGMSKKEVKRSIQSQILTVFFLPLVAAVIHIAVAFRIITKLLVLLNLVNVPLFMNCTIATVVVFAVFYGIVYALTAREYYRLVN